MPREHGETSRVSWMARRVAQLEEFLYTHCVRRVLRGPVTKHIVFPFVLGFVDLAILVGAVVLAIRTDEKNKPFFFVMVGLRCYDQLMMIYFRSIFWLWTSISAGLNIVFFTLKFGSRESALGLLVISGFLIAFELMLSSLQIYKRLELRDLQIQLASIIRRADDSFNQSEVGFSKEEQNEWNRAEFVVLSDPTDGDMFFGVPAACEALRWFELLQQQQQLLKTTVECRVLPHAADVTEGQELSTSADTAAGAGANDGSQSNSSVAESGRLSCEIEVELNGDTRIAFVERDIVSGADC